jgi:recombination protein RecT
VRHEKDEWIHEEGFSPNLIHRPHDGDDPGPLRSVYCVITMKDGTRMLTVMSKVEVEKIRGRSRSGNSGPWVTDFEEMARKTVVRRALKYCPLSSEKMERALSVDDEDTIDGSTIVAEALAAPALKERVRTKSLAWKVTGDEPPPVPPFQPEIDAPTPA